MSGDHFLAWVGNSISIGAIISTLLGWTPSIAAVVALIWYLIQIFESATLRNWFAKRRLHRLTRLRAEVLMLEARLQQDAEED
jgi:hypothetical protein